MNVPQPPSPGHSVRAVDPARWKILRSLPRWAFWLIGILFFLVVWFGVVGAVQTVIAPDPALRPTVEQLPAGGSVAIGFAARLIDVEVNERNFTPNDPLFMPTGLARKTPAYQAQVIAVVRDAVRALAAESTDERLAVASEALHTPADQWWLHAGWPPIRRSAERAYRDALVQLEAYNAARASDAAAGASASVAVSAQAMAVVSVLADAIDAEAAHGDLLIQGISEESIAVQFASARGTAHAAAMILRGLRDDNAAAIRRTGKAARWAAAIDALDSLAAMSPLVVREADLVRAGYQLLIASAAMREILS